MNPVAIVLMLLVVSFDIAQASSQRGRGPVAYSSVGAARTPGWGARSSYFQGARIYIPPAVSYARPGGVFVYSSYPHYRLPKAYFSYAPPWRYPHWPIVGYPSIIVSTPYVYGYYSYSGGSAYPPPPIAAPVGDGRVRGEGQWAPYDPTPQDVVDRMLKLAEVKQGDVLYDLGAGDGRIVIAAAKKYGVKAVGFEIDAGLVKLARENVRKQGVEKLVEIRQQDFLSADLSGASVVTLYLSYDGNQAARAQLANQLRPGARVVSYTFDMGDWPAKITESYRDSAGDLHMMYLWQIAAPAVYGEGRATTHNVEGVR
ncbi:MAG: methyltransferase domain-containing protein [Deltaproteobacteria bacterium]|nr:methyltransferase domain-containing protein [Deltaproteobacteria bacterium]